MAAKLRKKNKHKIERIREQQKQKTWDILSNKPVLIKTQEDMLKYFGSTNFDGTGYYYAPYVPLTK